MRAYVIDEIPTEHTKRVVDFLKKHAMRSALEHIFWIQLPDDLLTETQYAHHGCRPHVFAVEWGEDWLRLEFFIRSLKRLRCDCPAYATRQQREFIIEFAHHILHQLEIPV